MTEELVTVFMPVYNGEQYVSAAIESLLRQTYPYFELLVIDDGSTDRTAEILQKYKEQDPRVRIIVNETNKGITYSRNLGIKEARGKYLALLDSDDLAMPDRLSVQVNFMESYPHIAMSGGHAVVIGSAERQQIKVPVGTDEPSGVLPFQNSFVNSSLIFRLDKLKEIGSYYEGLCEDYDMSVRIHEYFTVANQDVFLVQYRVHADNTSFLQRQDMERGERHVIKRVYASLGLAVDEDIILLHHQVFFKGAVENTQLKKCFDLLVGFKSANHKGRYHADTVNRILFEAWFAQIRRSKTPAALYWLFKGPLFAWRFLTFKMLRRAFKQSIGISR